MSKKTDAGIVIIELFGGLAPAAIAVANLGVTAAHYYSEICPDAINILQHHFPQGVLLGDTSSITRQQVHEIVQRQWGALFAVVGDVPCNEVSVLRRGAFSTDHGQSALYLEAGRICDWYRRSTRAGYF